MSDIVSCSFFCSFTCGLVQYLLETNQEESLYRMGKEVGVRWLELKQKTRDVSLVANLQKLTFSILPELYSSKRTIERGDEDGTFILTETTSLFSKFVSVPKEYEGFSIDIFVCGFIEAILKGFGYDSKVEAIYRPIEDDTIYFIRIKNKNE
ncbi:putative trafficking protein particle complex subunit TRS31 [Astathelohania contejeani]|uniref:Trafficking protein particle complex subunit TRS31 n=1 Tax=Astathelohania contejeani TaxID=164912 RepID=A0ABQ7HW18_9MICR|nr:putative trafficking protein particle complex subunit TRS31 [Thelohania contejeani]